MGKSTKKKNKKITAPKANIQELSISRDGGQIALRGYSYQFLYSCYLILSSSNPSNFFQLEGIEDIDCEYYGAAEPPVRCGESHLSGLTEPPHFVY